ncbi:endonuclease [Frankia casuarinae]|uniref:endonuclease/exonuclease/phosphatase family protein n=1 Tax=Frankia TaxID=1854 RepID=UPI00055B2604|nr:MULTISPECIES: endonuclease/exonuclease/phosphatase family protein [Frankia]ORT98080.1 endonuclease [Frankia casuarinae]
MSSAQESGSAVPDTDPTSRHKDIPVAALEPRPHPTFPVRPLVVIVAWVAAAGLGGIALGRLAHLDDAVGWPYSAINAGTELLYLPAYATVAVAFALRRNLLMIISMALIAIHLFWTLPEVFPGGAEEAPQGAARLRVMSANLLYYNDHADRLGAQIRAANPDVLVLVELSPLTLARVTSSGALASYRYREVHPEPGAFGAAVFSRFPLHDAAAPIVGGAMSLRATVEVDERRRFVVYAVHTISPTTSAYTDRWRTQLDTLRAQLEHATLPVVMAGDFNATRDHRPFRRLVNSGVRDAHDVVGGGWQPTWNSKSLILPPVLRIDHVLASPAFAVTGFEVGGDFGSDHRPVIADLAMR